MRSTKKLTSGVCLGLGLFLFGMGVPNILISNTGNSSVRFIERASAQTSTCLSIYNQLAAESINTGGNYGLVNEKTSLSTAWAKLTAASDAKANAANGTISDGKGNVYVKYIQSSTATFQGKGYNLVGSISLSSGPDAVKKIRFTKP